MKKVKWNEDDFDIAEQKYSLYIEGESKDRLEKMLKLSDNYEALEVEFITNSGGEVFIEIVLRDNNNGMIEYMGCWDDELISTLIKICSKFEEFIYG